MSGIFKKLVYLFLIFAVTATEKTVAKDNDFFDVIDYAVIGTGTNKKIDANMYGARATTAWNDANQDGNLDETEYTTETIKLYDRNGKLAVESPMNLNRDAMEKWATDHADEILEAIFPSGFSEATGESDDSMTSEKSLNKILKKVNPLKQTQTINDDFKGALEYTFVDANDNDGQAASMVIGYNSDFAGSFEVGFMLPYRYTSIDDELNSESHFVGLDFYGKYPVMKWNNVTWNIGGDIFGSVYYLTSDAIEHCGNLKYGGGLYTSVITDFNFGKLSVGMDYKISKANVPSGLVDTDNEFVEEVIDYINDLEAVHTFSYGFNFGVPIADVAAVNLEVIRSNFFSDNISDDRDSKTVAGISFSYYASETFELNLGYRQTFELEDIDLKSVIFGAIYRF